jgi:hypothetical protein
MARKGRTKGGSVKATTRKKYGARKGSKLKKGSFPVFDTKSALSAIKLRGHAKSKKAVLNKVAHSKAAKSPTVKTALKRARKKDRKG